MTHQLMVGIPFKKHLDAVVWIVTKIGLEPILITKQVIVKKIKSTIFKTGENSRAIFSSEIGGLTQVPASCCKEDADCNPDGIKLPGSEQKIKAKIYTKGCVSTLQTILKDKKILIGISSFVILIGFFLAVVTSCNLARDMCEENMAEDPKYHRHSI